MLKLKIYTGWDEENSHKTWSWISCDSNCKWDEWSSSNQRWKDVGKHTKIQINCPLIAIEIQMLMINDNGNIKSLFEVLMNSS